MRKKILFILIALTLVSLGLSLIPNVISQPENIKILGSSHYISQGILFVVGEAQNVGPNTVDSVILTGSVTPADGSPLVASYSKVWVSYLSPQQKAPFVMQFYPPGTANFWEAGDVSAIELTPFQANATSKYQYPNLEIASSSATIGSGDEYNGAYLVNGIIKNTGSQIATNITVVGAFYNSTGSVVSVGYTNFLTPADLNPSGTVSFQIAAFDLNQNVVPASQKISSYSLLVQTQLPILEGSAPIVTPTQGSGTPQTSSSPTDANSNDSSNSNIIYAIAIVVVIVIIAGTIVALRKHKKPYETVKEVKNQEKPRGKQ